MYNVYIKGKEKAMTKIKNLSSREIINLLQDDGWKLVGTRGDHHQFKHSEKEGKITVPHPQKNLTPKVIASIFKQAGWK